MKTSELIGPALDWVVAKCEGATSYMVNGTLCINWGYTADVRLADYSPSTDWSQGEPIIERERISIVEKGQGYWNANIYYQHQATGDTPLIAAMRCYVAGKFAGEIDVPEELLRPN